MWNAEPQTLLSIALVALTYTGASIRLKRRPNQRQQMAFWFGILVLLLWWPMLSPLPEYPRLSYPMQILYLFLLMIPMTAVAAPITMAETVLYMYYGMGVHPFGLTPLADQVLGGLIMWIGQGVYIMF